MTWTIPIWVVVTALLHGDFARADGRWFAFNRAFVESHYAADQAFSSLKASKWVAAGSPHPSSCDGKDAELHIGAKEAKLTLDPGKSPLSSPSDQTDSDWGVVAAGPNASAGAGPTKFASIKTKPVTFHGYLRVWNEGHDVGQVFDSNPHHVLEVHPAWGFEGGTVNFEDRTLIRGIAGFHGYGATKFKPVLNAIKAGTWPLAFQTADAIQVKLTKADNFYQLPVKITQLNAITGGHEVTVDVFSKKNHTNLVYSGLRCVTVEGSPFDDLLGSSVNVGDKLYFLGFFSVNLKRALQAAAGASSEATAVPVQDAVEFLVFGKAPELGGRVMSIKTV